jgi:hypothetical protein
VFPPEPVPSSPPGSPPAPVSIPTITTRPHRPGAAARRDVACHGLPP